MPTMTMEAIRIREIEQEQLPLTALQRALLQAGVKILDTEDVQAYQQAKLQQARKAAVWPHWKIAITLASLPFYAAMGFWTRHEVWSGVLCYLLILIAQIFALSMASAASRRVSRLLEWRRYTVWQAGGSHLIGIRGVRFLAPGVKTETVVPPEGVAICERVSETGAWAIFDVEQLDADPFLRVSWGQEAYYLFAWDENGFVPR